MEELFSIYKRFLEERLEKKHLLYIGEDSIRYDFFAALMETYGLKPSQIQIEVAVNNLSFVPVNNKKSKRKEKPLIDLIVDEDEVKISVEFGLFRQNSNEDGSINKTSRLVKMLNDMIRVSLEARHTGTKGLFVCIADSKMIGHKLRNRFIERFPSDYELTNEFIDEQLLQKTSNFDKRFLSVFQPLNKKISAKLILNEELKSSNINKETRLLIWEVALIN